MSSVSSNLSFPTLSTPHSQLGLDDREGSIRSCRNYIARGQHLIPLSLPETASGRTSVSSTPSFDDMLVPTLAVAKAFSSRASRDVQKLSTGDTIEGKDSLDIKDLFNRLNGQIIQITSLMFNSSLLASTNHKDKLLLEDTISSSNKFFINASEFSLHDNIGEDASEQLTDLYNFGSNILSRADQLGIPLLIVATNDNQPLTERTVQVEQEGFIEVKDNLSLLASDFRKTLSGVPKAFEDIIVALKSAAAPPPKKPEKPRATLPKWITDITESAARGLVKLVKNTPWAKDALKGICHTSETMIWLVGLGLSLPMILPTILYGTIASLPTIGLSAIALVALATVGKHFMACLKYELKHTPPAPVTAKETAAKAGA